MVSKNNHSASVADHVDIDTVGDKVDSGVSSSDTLNKEVLIDILEAIVTAARRNQTALSLVIPKFENFFSVLSVYRVSVVLHFFDDNILVHGTSPLIFLNYITES